MTTVHGGRPAVTRNPRPRRRGRPEASGDLWIDLINPTPEEEANAEAACGLRLPTREALVEVESSSRHHLEGAAIYLSAPLLANEGEGRPRLAPVGFILTAERLVTVRYEALKAFDVAWEQEARQPSTSGFEAFVRLAEAIVDVEADALERIGEELEEVGHAIFTTGGTGVGRRPAGAVRALLRRLGVGGEGLGKLRHSLSTLIRITAFAVDKAPAMDRLLRARLVSARDDLDSLARFQEALTDKSQFLLDAALGFINIDQNDIIKVLTVASVVGVPPTLVASIYGMNFKGMPELEWRFGYVYALVLIVLTTVLPLAWFKAKRWF